MKIRKYISSALLVFFISAIIVNANGSIKWYSFKEGYEKAKKEKKFLLVDFYTDWCKWCKVMDEKTYSQQQIINELNKNFVLVKLNPEKEGTVIFNGETYTNANFARAAQVSGYPATGFFTRTGDFISTIMGYQDVDKFNVILEYILNEHYMKFGYEDFQLFKRVEDKYKDDPKNADLNFVMGYFYESMFLNNSTAKKHYLKSIESSPKYSEVYSSLYLMSKKANDKTETNKWQEKAKSAGLKNEEQIMNKLKDVIKSYL